MSQADRDLLSPALESPFETAIQPRVSWLLWGGGGYLLGGERGAILGIGLNVLLVWSALAAGRAFGLLHDGQAPLYASGSGAPFGGFAWTSGGQLGSSAGAGGGQFDASAGPGYVP